MHNAYDIWPPLCDMFYSFLLLLLLYICVHALVSHPRKHAVSVHFLYCMHSDLIWMLQKNTVQKLGNRYAVQLWTFKFSVVKTWMQMNVWEACMDESLKLCDQ